MFGNLTEIATTSEMAPRFEAFRNSWRSKNYEKVEKPDNEKPVMDTVPDTPLLNGVDPLLSIDGMDVKLPQGIRLTATGQLAVAACSLTVCLIFFIEKSSQCLKCVIRRLNAAPVAPGDANRYVYISILKLCSKFYL